ncbi:hypothetical protein NDU88_002078 [Pleurodeles waltl]|uniref:Uncharacterized protein n=1 Tax=Pleurodeles waltl TaxID=8319 RepID=A0AAV7WK82_PLEWA|nr:hypothetical protein NDU88_002078 [Pleurodeles waltl]
MRIANRTRYGRATSSNAEKSLNPPSSSRELPPPLPAKERTGKLPHLENRHCCCRRSTDACLARLVLREEIGSL